jgi:hypothetical protein
MSASNARASSTTWAVDLSRSSQDFSSTVACPVCISSLRPQPPGTRELTRLIGLPSPASVIRRFSTSCICCTV